jgi:hypothetical protein
MPLHSSHHQCTRQGRLCGETDARCGALVSRSGRVEHATRVHATQCRRAQTWHEPCGSQQNMQR